ncbi:MAG: cobyric acid synthase [Desulfocapsaceae bacterium]|nr:cobyric acid synthase [Desulfocapsaceae bacterium]
MHSLSASRGHGGNIHLLARKKDGSDPILDFSANINPLGPPAWVRRVISRNLSTISHYPDPQCHEFVHEIAQKYAVSADQVIPANGTTEILYQLPAVLSCKRAVIPVPSYIDYEKVMELHNVEIVHFQLFAENNFEVDVSGIANILQAGDVFILGSPNNPTGVTVNSEDILDLAKANPESWFVVDEAFLGFVENGLSVAGAAANIITLHSLTKFYAIPGLRLGFGVFPTEIAARLRKILPPWSVNSLAQAVGSRLFADDTYYTKTRQYVTDLQQHLHSRLSAIPGLTIFPSATNYFLIKINGKLTSEELFDKLLCHHIAIRICTNYQGLDSSYFRVAVRTKEENEQLIYALEDIFVGKSSRRVVKSTHKKPLMIQGTSSNAGKSVLVAALCRIFIQDGIRVAPFKAQNMSLNSFVTHDGLEMGRAQVVQAQAAKLDPDVRMNPILLKPNSDVGSQIIVNGKPVGNMTVKEYVDYKNSAASMARQSFDQLAAEYQAVILEGAGSPGEVNLKHHDLVNMQMARYADAQVLLVGDIDRGGVYASFVGTMEVLEEWERQLVAGFLVNRFRGDASLLQSAHDYLFDHTGKPVLGIIPYIQNLGIPEEDSVSFKDGKLQKPRPLTDHIEIALINIPHISNFTDIEPFLDEPDVYLNIVSSSEELINPDAVILPGSKNVIGDLQFLQDTGLADRIKNLAENGSEIVGICGGYQILGKTIKDPYKIESDQDSVSALGLLAIETTLERDKTLTRQKGTHLPSGNNIHGYEIHHGLSSGITEPLLRFNNNDCCGTRHTRLPIWGAYLHGIFDADSFRRWFIDNLRQKNGLDRVESVVAPYNLEHAFDQLADTVRQSLDMEQVYALIDQ